MVGDLTFSGTHCDLTQGQSLSLLYPSMRRLAITKYFCRRNFQAHPLGARWGQRGGQRLQASFKWFHYGFATEMSRNFWPGNSGAKEVFRIAPVSEGRCPLQRPTASSSRPATSTRVPSLAPRVWLPPELCTPWGT